MEPFSFFYFTILGLQQGMLYFVYAKIDCIRVLNSAFYGPKGYIIFLKGEIMMDEERKLLSEVAKARLNQVLKSHANDEECSDAFEQAMDAIDRELEFSRIEASREEQIAKDEQSKREAKREVIIRCVEIGAAAIITPVVYYFTNKGFAKFVCLFEKDDYFSTTAGKSLSKLFRFGK